MPPLRSILHRVSGEQRGPIRRLISPQELGEQLKPFIFLDFFNAEIEPGFGFAMHPHSGIATLTWQPGSDVRYRDTTGKNGVLKAGGLEWMNAGGGAWHQGQLLGSGRVEGFQLWLPMPPDVEDGRSFGQYVAPEDVPTVKGPGVEVRVLLGALTQGDDAVRSPIDSHQDLNYFVVELEKGSTWRYDPPEAHTVAFAFGFGGDPQAQGVSLADELAVFSNVGAIELRAAAGAAKILLGTAKRHEHPLICGPSSVHTNANSLAAGLQQIQELGSRLEPVAR